MTVLNALNCKMRLQNLTSELSLKQFINKPDIGSDLLHDAYDQCLLDGFNLLNLRLGKKMRNGQAWMNVEPISDEMAPGSSPECTSPECT